MLRLETRAPSLKIFSCAFREESQKIDLIQQEQMLWNKPDKAISAKALSRITLVAARIDE